MAKNIDIAFVPPQFINAENPQNFHLFEGHFNPSTKRFTPTDGKSCCGNYTHVRNGQFDEVTTENSIEATLRKAREIAKRLETEGKNICGRCVATLYRDNI